MSEKGYNNVFKFSLQQENVLLCEKVFDADQFNPFTRYSIDIRDILPRAITKFQKILSKRNYDVVVGVGNGVEYDLYEYNQEVITSYPQIHRADLRYNPQPIVQQIDDKTIRGVECKIGLYINDNPIVERLFYVDGYNPMARWSLDLTNLVVEVADTIFEKIKNSDVKNMWDDYDLINYRGLSISQIRELSPAKRDEMLRKLKKY